MPITSDVRKNAFSKGFDVLVAKMASQPISLRTGGRRMESYNLNKTDIYGSVIEPANGRHEGVAVPREINIASKTSFLIKTKMMMSLLILILIGLPDMLFGQTQNMYWSFNESSCAGMAMTTSPANTNLSGTYTYTGPCSTTTGIATSGTPLVNEPAAGNAVRKSLPANDVTMYYWYFTLSGSDLKYLSNYSVYFQMQRSLTGNTNQPMISYSIDGNPYTGSQNIGYPLTSWSTYNFDFSSISGATTSLTFRIQWQQANPGGAIDVDLDNFQVQATFPTSPTSFTTPGTSTFLVPAGVTSLTVECWGGGGGGSTITSTGRRGGGGGGGAYASSVIAVTPGNSYSVVVGSGGSASSNGGNSTFNSNAVIAAGGSGGTDNSSTGGSGGTTANSTGTTKYAGGDGADGGGTYSGGGGGGAGTTGSGGNAPTAASGSHGTGTSLYGGNGGSSVSGRSNGNTGFNYGGGGSGASTNSSSDRTGGSGADGQIIISWPILTIGPLTGFGAQCINSTSGPNSFTITGSSLTTEDITVGALPGFSYSITSGGTYTASLSLGQSGGSYFQTIYVKFSPTLVQSYDGNIPVGGGGVTQVNVAASGSGINTAPGVTAGVATGITLTTATIPGTITVTGCTAITSFGVEFSTSDGFANGTGTAIDGTNLAAGSFSVPLSGLTQSTPYYYHTYAINGGGTSYSAQGTFTTSSPTISTGTVSGSPFCVTTLAGKLISVPFSSVGIFNPGNIYTAQLSNAAGSFAGATDIGTLVSVANSDVIDATIPAGTPTGAGYRVRVISSDPSITGTDNGSDLAIDLPQNSIDPGTTQNISAGKDGSVLTVTETPDVISREWATSTTSGGSYTGTGSTDITFVPNFPLPGTYYVVCISTYSCDVVTSNEVQFIVVASVNTGTIDGSPFCSTASAGSAISVPFTSAGLFSGNIYTAELSNASGSFASPVTIGTLADNSNSGSIPATIPAGTATGSGYRIRVNSSNPAITGYDNGTDLTINLSSNHISPTLTQNIAAGANGSTLTVTETPAALSRVWATSTTSMGPYTPTSFTGTTYVPNFPLPGTYYIVCKSTFSCDVVTSNQVQVNVSGSITTGTITGSPFCVTIASGSSVSVPFTSLGTFNGNTYTAQLSNSAGSFAAPTSIGTLTSDGTTGTISATIPAGTPSGTGYRIRVVSSSPVLTGTNNGVNLTVNLSTNSIAPASTQNIDAGSDGTTLAVVETPAAATRVWATSTLLGGPYDLSTSHGLTYIPHFSIPGTYYVVCISNFPCGDVTSNAVQINVSATVTTGTIDGSPFCVTTSATSPVSVPFTSVGSFTGDNTYTAELSDESGSFLSPAIIGTLSSAFNSGTINATIPAGKATGNGYRIRVVSSDPAATGTDNGIDLTINLSGNSIGPNGTQDIDASVDGTTLTVSETPAALSREWATSQSFSGPWTGTALTETTFVPNFPEQGTYYVVCISHFPCGDAISNVVQVNVSAAIFTGAIIGSPFCVRETDGFDISVPFTSLGVFSDNTYTAQLSDATGSFSNPVTIGTLTVNDNLGTIPATLPAATPTGNGYRIRVISTNPSVVGTPNPLPFTINLSSNVVTPGTTQNINAGVDGATLTVTPTPASLSRVWAVSGTHGGPYINTAVTGFTFVPNFSEQGPHYVVCISTFPCGTVTSNEVLINVSATITTGSISGSPFCTGAAFSVPFTSVGIFTGNTYTAQLSDPTGSFSSPTLIGTLISDDISGTIDATIPGGTATGTGYRIRVVSNNPVVTGSPNTTNLTINLSTNSIAPTTPQTIDVGVNGSPLTVTESPAAISRVWATSTLPGGPYTNTASTGITYYPNFDIPGTYYVVCVSTFNCGTKTSNEVQINVNPTIETGQIFGSPFCVTLTEGADVLVPFTSLGTFNNNTFSVELSNAAGSFNNPLTLGSLTSNDNSGAIIVTIPAGTPTGTGYRMRVVSSSPAVTGTDNGTNLIINLPANSIAPVTTQNNVAGVPGTPLTVTESQPANTRYWATSTVPGGPYNTTGVTTILFAPTFAVQGTYYIVCVSVFDCQTVTSNEVRINVSAIVSTGNITGSPFCSTSLGGSPVIVPFTSAGIFTGNTYTAQLSGPTGSFSSPTDIGSILSDLNSGNINAVIPPNTPTGNGYRIRVISSVPALTGTDNGSNLTINLPAVSIAPSGVQNITAGANGTPLTVTESAAPAALGRVWATSQTPGGPYTNTGSTGTSFIPNFLIQGTYYVVCISTFSCSDVISNEVQVDVTAGIVTGTVTGSPFCAGSAVSVPFTSSGSFTGNTYTAELSNSAGSFASPVTIGTLVSNASSGTISATIPDGTITGSGYLIRVIANSPATTGSSSSAITVNAIPQTTTVTVCQYGSGELTSSTTCPSTGGTSGPNQASTGNDVSGTGTVTWAGTGNIFADDGNYASATISSSSNTYHTHYLQGTNYGFAIPADANILGIQVSINRFCQTTSGSSNVQDNIVSLIKGGTVTGSDRSLGGNWSTSTSTVVDYGGTSDLWGTTWSAAEINASDFGIALSSTIVRTSGATVSANVDYMTITVTYSVAGVINWWTASSGGTMIGSGSTFNPVGVAGSPLANTNTPGTTTFYAECSTMPGCRAATDFVITPAPSTPDITAGGTTEICTTSGEKVTLTSSSAPGYQWYRDGILIPSATFQYYDADMAGTYTVVTNDGCNSLPSNAITVTSNVPAITIFPAAASTCFNSSADQYSALDFSSVTNSPDSYSITWADPAHANGLLDLNDNLPSVSPINIIVPAGTAAGTYTGTLTVKRGSCISQQTDFTLTVNPNPVATFSYSSGIYCNSSIYDNPSPTYSGGGVAGIYSAEAGLAFVDIHTGQIDLPASQAGIYHVRNTVTANGCSSFYEFQVTIIESPVASISYTPNAVCSATSAIQSVHRTWVAGDGVGSYSANPSGLSINTLSDENNTSAGDINPAASISGTYTIQYLYGNGTCNSSATTTFTVYGPPELTDQPSPSAVEYCQSGIPVPLSVTATPGSDKNGLIINTYSITNYEWYSNTTASNVGGSLVASGPAMSSFSPNTTDIGSLYYYCVITNNHGCTVTTDVSGVVKINPPINGNTIAGDQTLCSGYTPDQLPGSSPTGGNDSYSFVWETSSNGINFTTAPGIFNEQNYAPGALTDNTWFNRLVNSGGCSSTSASIYIEIIPSPVAFAVTGSATICSGTSSYITLSGSQLGNTYQLINTADNSNVGDVVVGDGGQIYLSTGSLTSPGVLNVNLAVQATNSDLCTALMTGTATITVVPEVIDNSISASSPAACPGEPLPSISGSIPQGGDGNYLYTWLSSSDGISFVTASGISDDQDYTPDVLTSDTYYMRIVSSGPCTASSSNIVKLGINPLPATPTVSGPLGGEFCSITTLNADNGGDGTIYYQGTTPNNKDTRYATTSVDINASGTYYFRAFNLATGCWSQDGSIAVTVGLPPSTIGTSICQGGSGALISAATCPSPTTGLSNFPGTGADNSGVGSIAWTNPNNISTSGAPYAIASAIPPSGGISHYLMATNFGFNLPLDATINGITVTINRSSSGNQSPYLKDNVVRLVRGGVLDGVNKAKATDWPTSLGETTYGANSDKWGTTALTAADINSPNFGVALSATNSNTGASFPVVAGTATSRELNNVNNHTVDLPSGIAPNDLLLILWSDRQRSGADVNTPTGWTRLYYYISTNSARSIAWYRIADGTEGTSVSITSTGTSMRSAHNSYRIAAGTYQGIPVAATPAHGTSANPDPPVLTSGFGATGTLWIAASHSDAASNVTAPAGYSNLIQVYSNTGLSNSTFYATMASATKYAATVSDDPAPFAITYSEDWAANTIAIIGAPIVMDATVDYMQITVTYTINGILKWFTSPTGGTSVQSGAPFNPVGDPEVIAAGAPYYKLVDSDTPGTYTFWSECSSSPGCRTKTDFVINEVPVINNITKKSYNGADLSCATSTDGEITVDASGTTALQYSKDNGVHYQTSNVFSGLGSGTYDIVVQNTYLCTSSIQVTITAPPVLAASITAQTNVLCFGNSTGSATVTAIGGTVGSGYTYSWSPSGGAEATATGLAAGPYTVTVTDANLCTTTVDVTITEPAAALTAVLISQVNVSCFGGSNGSAVITPAGGTSPYVITPAQTGLTAGLHTFTITDANLCTTTVDVTITEPSAALTAVLTSQVNVSCFGGSNGSAVITPAGGTSPYVITPAQTGLTAGLHTFTVTDANLCTTTVDVTITEPSAALTAVLTSQVNVSCFGGSNGSAVITPAGGTSPYVITPAQTGLTAGLHTFTVTDANLCTTTVDVTITEPSAALTAVLTSQVNVSCFGGSNGSAVITPAGGTSPYVITPAQTGLTAGLHTFTVTDANLCTTTVDVTITEPSAALSATILSQTDVLCFGNTTGSATVTAAGGTPVYTYSWAPTGGTNATATGLAAGPYTVTVTDANLCTTTVDVTITEPSAALTAVLTSQVNVSCFGGSNGSAVITPAGGTSPYVITPAQTGLTAGLHTFTITDANLCTTTVDVTITEPSAALTAVLTSQVNVSCFGGSNGSAVITPAGGTSPYVITPAQTGLTAGLHTFTVTDANLCTTTVDVTITEPSAALSATILSQTDVLCFGNTTGSATVTAAGGTPVYTYSWAPTGGTNATATGLAAGPYTVTVTDANLCTTTVDVTITEPSAALSATITSQTDVLCFGNTTGSATVTAAGGTPVYTYSWAPTGGTNATATGLAAGLYTVTVTDANLCTTTVDVTITEPSAALTAVLTSQVNVSCFGGSNGSAVITPAGGTAPYVITPAQTGLTAGLHTFTITDANLCTTTVDVTITEPAAALTAVLTSQVNVSCFGGSNGSAVITPAGGTSPYVITPAQTGLTAGLHTFTVTDANLCTTTVDVTITEPAAALSATILSQTDVLCFGNTTGSATVTAAGGTPVYTYSWAPTGGTNATATGLAAGPYTVTVTDANLCTTTVDVTITEPSAALTAVLTSQVNVSCFGGSNGSAVITPAGGTSPYVITPSQTGLTAGLHTFTITDANLCTTTVDVTITEPSAALTAVLTSQVNVSCFGGSNGSAVITPAGGTSPYVITPAQTGLTAGLHTFTVTDANLCTTTVDVTITEPSAALTAVLTSQVNVSCFGGSNGSAVITPAGGTSPYVITPAQTGLTAGLHTFTVTDANLCTTTVDVTITEPSAALSATILSQTDVLCFGNTTGSATVTAAGGTPVYTYSWAPTGGTNATATGLAAGPYTVTVTDANLCTTTVDVTITEPSAALTAVLTSQVNVSCFGGSNGSAVITPAGGTSPYVITPAQTGLTAGLHTFTVTDANLCTTTVDVTITEPSAALSATILSQTDVLCFGNTTGSATVTAAGGTPVYTYSWAPTGGTNATATGLAAGPYTVTVTDANLCTTTVDVTITEPAAALSATILSQTDVLCFGNTTGSATVTAAGGTPVYTYSWAPTGGTNATATGLAAGPYTVTVTDANLCTTTVDVTITEPSAALTAVLTSQVNVSCFGGSNGSAVITPAGGTSPYVITPAQTGLTAGLHTFTVTDANLCTTTVDVTITEPAAALTAVLTSQVNVSCFGGSNGSAVITPAGGTSPYVITPAQTGLTAGLHTFTVTDANLCTTTVDVTITEPSAALSATITSQTDVLCFGNTTGSATVTAAGGTPVYTYSWAPTGGTNATATGLAAGPYTVTVTDANLCTTTVDVTITEPSAALTAVLTSQVNVSCFGGSNGSAVITPAGGTSPYVITPSQTGLTAGLHTFTITDANLCTTTVDVTITEPSAALTAVLTSQVNVSCFGGSNGSAVITPAGGTSPYVITPAQTGLTAGLHTFTVTDANLCTTTVDVTITEPSAALTAVLTSQVNVSCFGGSNGSAVITPAGGTSPYVITPAQTGLTAGLHTFTVTDANLCTTTVDVTITEPSAALSATILSQTDVLCFGNTTGSATVTAAGGTPVYTYSWAPTGGTNATATGLAAGPYTVTVTDANLCTTTVDVTITEPSAALTAVLTSQVNVSCFGGSNGSAVITPAGGTSPYVITPSQTGLTAGLHTFTITDANLCTTTVDVTITEPSAALTAVLTSQVNVSCFGGSNGSAVITPAGGTSPYVITPAQTGLTAGLHTFTVTDANLCTTTVDVTITEPSAALTAVLTSQVNVSCFGGSNGSAVITPAGGTSPYVITPAQTGLTAGLHTFTVTDANLCTTTVDVTITEPSAALSATILSQTDVLCFGNTTGSATVTAAGGTPVYTYSWAPTGGTNATATGLAAGPYTVTVTDANLCTTTVDVTITEPSAALTAVLTSQVNVSCFGGSNGSAVITPAGGTSPYVITPAQTGLTAGLHTFTITDANLCTTTVDVTITEPAVVTVTSASVTPTTLCGAGNVIFSAMPSEGNIVWYDALTNGNVVTPPTSIIVTTTLYAEAVSIQGCTSATRTAVTAIVNPVPALPVAGINTYAYDGSLKTASATVGVNEVIDWYTALIGGSLTTAPTGTMAGSYIAWAEARNTATGCVSASRLQVTLTITQSTLTITANPGTKVYGDIATFAGTEFTAIGLVNADAVTSVTLTSAGAAATATVAGSPYPIVASAAVGTGLTNYTISYVPGILTVDQKTLTITANNLTKPYGQTLTFAGTEFSSAGLVNGDAVTSVTLTSTGAAAAATVAGSPYPIVASAAVGTGLSNYTIGYVDGSLTVNPLTLTITANSMTKNYGDVVTFAGTEFTTSGLVNADAVTSVTLTSAGAAATAAVAGSPYPIVASAAVGTGLDNYTIGYVDGNLTVNPIVLTITATSMTKTYGETVTFAGTEFTVAGLINGDVVTSVTLTSAGAAQTATVAGSPYAITPSAAIGTGLGNYTIGYFNSTLTVTQRVLTVGGTFTVNNKEYDGNTSATFASNNLTLLTLVGSDNVILNATPVFVNEIAGTGKLVTLTDLSIAGPDAPNYTLSLNGLPATTADITQKVLTIGGSFTVNNKVYDGTTAATIAINNLTLLTKVGSDDVALTAVVVFDDKAIGTGKTVTLTGSSLTGTDAGNYVLSLTGAPVTTADITPLSLTIGGTFTVNDKVYDATVDATISSNFLTLLTIAGTDDVSLNAVAAFSDKVVGTGKTVRLTGSTLTGNDAGNYTLSLAGAPETIADITVRELTIGGSFTANNKVYDGTTSATIMLNNLTLLTVAGTDDVTLNAVAVFDDVAVGTGKTVRLTGSTISGGDASNYSLSLTGSPTATATITEFGLSVSGVTADNKLYDGTTAATLNISGATLEGVIGTDVVTLESTGVTGAFIDKTVGIGKTVVITGFTITGPDADKYSLTQPTAMADITAINLTITGVTAGNKVYDGTTVAVLNTDNAAVEGVLAGDDVSLVSSGATGTFAGKDIGLGKTVTTSGFAIEGNDAVNYTLTQPTFTADITPAPLTISGVTANNKTYDGTTVATLNTGSASLAGVAGTDVISLITTDATGAFADKNVGTGKPVTTSGFAISGVSADNYTLTQPELIADITSKGLTITAHNLSKTYGTELIFAGTEFSVSGLVAGDPVPGVIISSDGAPALADVGTYPIVITGGSDSNYDYTYVDGVLTVGKADQVITFAEIPSGLRMTQDYTLDAIASSGLPVSFEISNPNIASVDGNTLLINQDGTFTITAIQEGDQNWNPATDVIQAVSTLPTFDKITSLFTPNNDGMNDYWYIPHLEDYGKLQVTVYNRYGQAVYKSDSYKNDWDGTWNGYPLPSASYYYIIRSSTKGIIKGVVNIVR